MIGKTTGWCSFVYTKISIRFKLNNKNCFWNNSDFFVDIYKYFDFIVLFYFDDGRNHV